PALDAPASPGGRVSAMSIRPAFASTAGTKVGVAPPCRMNDPCVTVGRCTTAGSNVIVSETAARSSAPETVIGTVYGPPPASSVPSVAAAGGLSTTRTVPGTEGGAGDVAARPGIG